METKLTNKLHPHEQLAKIIAIAAQAHSGQFDKGGKPYITHTLAVMYLLNSHDNELNAIAVGHDLFEDTKVTAQDLRDAGISERVISGIFSLTKQNGESYDEYVAKVMGSVDAMRVKCADLTHNSDIRRLKGVTEKDIDRIVKYHRLYLKLTAALKEHDEGNK